MCVCCCFFFNFANMFCLILRNLSDQKSSSVSQRPCLLLRMLLRRGNTVLVRLSGFLFVSNADRTQYFRLIFRLWCQILTINLLQCCFSYCAATKLQAGWKGYTQRSKYKKLRVSGEDNLAFMQFYNFNKDVFF